MSNKRAKRKVESQSKSIFTDLTSLKFNFDWFSRQSNFESVLLAKRDRCCCCCYFYSDFFHRFYFSLVYFYVHFGLSVQHFCSVANQTPHLPSHIPATHSSNSIMMCHYISKKFKIKLWKIITYTIFCVRFVPFI